MQLQSQRQHFQDSSLLFRKAEDQGKEDKDERLLWSKKDVRKAKPKRVCP